MHHSDRYAVLTAGPSPAPQSWAVSCTHQECSLHQLSPYIGKLKSVIARDLILKYTRSGELVVDMFCGSGTVPLEAARLGRRVFASDTSAYAVMLTRAKLTAPVCLDVATPILDQILSQAVTLPVPDLRRVPKWVRAFFHPLTLKNALRLANVLKTGRHDFFMAALLGILHHQRVGFLSHPSSHLVPYLRAKKFPKSEYPGLYEYRPVEPRLRAKIERALRRPPSAPLSSQVESTALCSARTIDLPDLIDCVVTSPPYMNALDYHRDNRLRLWFLGETFDSKQDRTLSAYAQYYDLMSVVAKQLESKVRSGGHCIFIAAERMFRGRDGSPSLAIARAFSKHAPSFQLSDLVADVIPDVRRSRRRMAGVKNEHILVFRKT